MQQHEEQIQQQEQQLLKQQEQEIEQLKDTITMHLQQSPKSCARPDLEEISRQILLTPRAKKLYKRTVQLKKERRRLKRRIKQLSLKPIRQFKIKKGSVHKTASVRQQFVNMILRNSNVAPQV